jgi:hypothetical protein
MKTIVIFDRADLEKLAEMQTAGRGFRVVKSEFRFDFDSPEKVELHMEVEELEFATAPVAPPILEVAPEPEPKKSRRGDNNKNLTPEQLAAKVAAMAEGKLRRKAEREAVAKLNLPVEQEVVATTTDPFPLNRLYEPNLSVEALNQIISNNGHNP